MGGQEVQEPYRGRLDVADEGEIGDRGRGATSGQRGVREAAQAMGGGADVRLAGAISEEQPGLRVLRGVERVDDQGLLDSSHAQIVESGCIEEGGFVQIPQITGNQYRIAS